MDNCLPIIKKLERGITINNFIFKESHQNIIEMAREYTTYLTGVCDDFWESHLLKSIPYNIIFEGNVIGYFSILNNEKITMFFIEENYMTHSQQIFKAVVETYNIKAAFVATCNEGFLSLCLDLHTKIELQAYFFEWNTCSSVKPPKYEFSCMKETCLDEIDKINKVTENFFKGTENNPTTKIYKLIYNNIVLGYGLLYQNPIVSEYYACGMVTLEQYRNQGVGRSIQIHLANICNSMGVKPISGCWYYNHNSKKTIESAGRFSKTRLLNIYF